MVKWYKLSLRRTQFCCWHRQVLEAGCIYSQGDLRNLLTCRSTLGSVWLCSCADTKAVLEKEVGYGLSACLFSVVWSICWQEMVKLGDPLVLFIVNVYVNLVVSADCNSCKTPPQRCSWINYLLLQSNQSREYDWVKALEFVQMRSMR